MAKKIDLEALRQQINELQIDKDLKHDLLAAINDKQRYGLVWEESSEEAWDEMQDQLPVLLRMPPSVWILRQKVRLTMC